MRAVATMLAGLLCIALHAAVAYGHGDHALKLSAPRPLAAHFQARATDAAGRTLGGNDWYFRRDAGRIETMRPGGGLAEIWQRDERGQITLTRVFRNDGRLVEYLPRELRAMRIDPSWEVLGTVIDRRSLDALKRGGTVRLPQGAATVYKGQLDGQKVEIWWLEQHALPARIERRTVEGRFVLALKALHGEPPAGWPHPNERELSEYLRIDAADFGDMAHDPFVQKVERMDALTGVMGNTLHSHHGH